MDSRCAANLKPAETVALAEAKSRAVFAASLGPLLLVRIEAHGDLAMTLEAALDEGSAAEGRIVEPTMAYDTVVASMAEIRASAKAVAGAVAGRASFAGPDLARRLSRGVHFAVTLRKRRGAANVFSERVSVGRARTNDIVLRHHSVSKFHAWFERDEDDCYHVSDAKSKNATLLNGVDIARTSPARVEAGDEIRFGDITTIFCSPEIVWDALMVGTPPSSRPRPAFSPPTGKPPSGGSTKRD